jgi:hypothetical protein
MALKMKPSCEKCNAALEPAGEAFVCSYECTFCPACTKAMSDVCPNCGGELVARPRRTKSVLAVAAQTPSRWWRRLGSK